MLLSNVGVGQSKITFITPQTLVYNNTNNLPEYFVSNTCTVPPIANYVDQETLGTIYNSNLAPIIPGNYRVTLSFNSGSCLTAPNATINFTITPMPLTVSATANNKEYDGNTTAVVGTLTSNKLGSDVIAIANTTATFADKNVGLAKVVTVSGISISGTDAGNYTLTSNTAITNADINKKPLTITIDASDKVYDGITYANPTITSDKLGYDNIDIFSSSAFNNKNIGIGKVVTTSITSITGTDAGNYSLTSATATGTASITVRSLTISATALDKIYDGNTTANVTLTDNKITGDDVIVNKTATFNNKNIGTGKAVAVSGITLTGADAGNYTLTSATASGTASITVRSLTISATASDKIYDGNTTANVILTDNKITGDEVTVNKTATFNNKNIGTGKAVAVSGISLTGTDAGNYTITSSTATGTASITVRSLTISATVSDKVYDGNTSANVTLTDNKITGDDVTVNKTATFNNKNIGTGKAVAVSGISLTGTDAGNYTITSSTATGTASITVRSLTISTTVSDKVYDGNTTANATLTDNKITGDDVTVNKTATFNNKNIGTSKAVTVSGISLTGTDAGNYSLTSSTATGTASITVKSLTVSATASDKIYDGNTSANVTLTDNKITGDDVTVNKTATFNNKNIGISKAVAVSGISLTGTDAGNYTITSSTATGTASITIKSLTISATASDKVYDGNTTANVALTDNRISGDVFTVDKTATFNNKNIGTGKAVAVSGISLTGTDAGNYTITSSTATGTASITVRSLTISATASDKVYDGNTTANLTLTDNRILGDIFTVEKTATFNNKNIGASKAVTVSGISLTGTDAGNYTITSSTATGTASITVKSLTISATVSDKVYDGNTTATASLTNNKISSDDVTVNKTGATFNNKNIGASKAVTVSGITLTGTDAGNYTLTSATATGTASITVKSLTISATVSDKVYDGITSATATLTDNRVTGDDLTVNKTGATFNNKNIGTGKAVAVSGITLTGTDAGNYTLTSATATGTASITVRSLTISATASDKVYDGNTTANATLTDNRVTGDDVTVNKTATFNDKNIGSVKTVNISGINLTGADASNYNLTNTTASATATITARNLIITAIAKNKLYDGNKTAEVTLTGNKINIDNINYQYTLAEFESPGPGDNKIVNISGISIAGIDAGNYSLTNTTATASANITGSLIPFAVPNAFTPNGDGKNDKFKIIFNNTTGVTLRMQIFNRNGLLLFSTNNISEEWDGRSLNGAMQDMGIYFVKYRIDIAGGMTYEGTPRLYLLK
jgi:gliding motility-associated-like protein